MISRPHSPPGPPARGSAAPARRVCTRQDSGCGGPAKAQCAAPGADFRGDAQTQPSAPAATIIRHRCRRRQHAGARPPDPAGRRDSLSPGKASSRAPAPARALHCTCGLRPPGEVLGGVTPPFRSGICISKHQLPSSLTEVCGAWGLRSRQRDLFCDSFDLTENPGKLCHHHRWIRN